MEITEDMNNPIYDVSCCWKYLLWLSIPENVSIVHINSLNDIGLWLTANNKNCRKIHTFEWNISIPRT